MKRKDRDDESETSNELKMHLNVNDIPPPNTALLYGFQQAMMSLSGLLVYPFLVADVACAGAEATALRVQLISITFVTCGIATILQTTFGLRLCVLHGPSTAFLAPLIAYQTLHKKECSDQMATGMVPEDFWQGRLREIQGSLLLACISFVLLGASGLAGRLARLVGPVTLVPLLSLLAINVADVVKTKMETHWIAIVMFLTLIVMTTYLEDFHVPIPYYKSKTRKIAFHRVRIFGQFPYLTSIGLVWLLCFILTTTGAISSESDASTHRNESLIVIQRAPWFNVPMPAPWGSPKISLGLFFGYLAAVVASVIENIGSYAMLARASHQRSPPSDAVNRGIMVEGVSSIISAAMGTSTAVTTYAENIALIHITRVAGILLIIMGLFTKVAAFLATIPQPIIGGILAMGMSMIAGVALNNLRVVNLSITRNLTIMGIAIMMGLVIPQHFKEHHIETGTPQLDETLSIVLGIPMLVGGVIACFLDNTVPGATKRDRGIGDYNSADDSGDDNGFAFSNSVEKFLDRYIILRRLPFLPSKSHFRSDESACSDTSSV